MANGCVSTIERFPMVDFLLPGQPQQQSGFQRFGNALSAFGAGTRGQGQQFFANQQQQLSLQRQQAAAEDLFRAQNFLERGDLLGLQNLAQLRLGAISQAGGDPSDTQNILSLTEAAIAGDQSALQNLNSEIAFGLESAARAGVIEAPTGPQSPQGKLQADIRAGLVSPETQAETRPSSLIEFEAMTQGLTEDQVKRARLIDLGLLPREVGAADKVTMIGGVPHRFDPASGEMFPIRVRGKTVTAKTVGEAEAEIADLTKRGEGKGALATKTIDKGFDSIGKINGNIRNIDRAIAALDKGAKTGAIQRFFPNIKAASVELGQIQRELGLDIVSAVTFGALSKGELDLALDTALPTDLDEPELRAFLERKKTAQSKLRDYYQEQVSFLDQGGSVPEFLKSQRGDDQPTEQEVDTGQVTATGERIIRLPDGSLVARQ